MEELSAERIEELKATFADLSHITVNRDGTLDMSDETRYGGPDFITDWSPLPDLNWGPPDVCLHRRLCFFRLQSGALPTELSEAKCATSLGHLTLTTSHADFGALSGGREIRSRNPEQRLILITGKNGHRY